MWITAEIVLIVRHVKVAKNKPASLVKNIPAKLMQIGVTVLIVNDRRGTWNIQIANQGI
jgi:hypothetical protein